MKHGLFVLSVTRTGEPINEWVKHYDPDDREGGGYVELTADPAEALTFEDPLAGMACWQMQSVTKPLREDGEPNRPLTAFTVSLRPVEISLHTKGWCPGECGKCPRDWYSDMAAASLHMTPYERAAFAAGYHPDPEEEA